MKLTTAVAASLAPFLASAMPTRVARTDSTSYNTFTVMALRSASPIHFLTMQAAGEKFYLGGEPATYCPTGVVASCPPGNETVIAGGYAMFAEVPGGQQLYVGPDGALGFTQAHSTNIPVGSTVGPFNYTAGSPLGQYSFVGWGASGFMACPDNAETPSTWQVFGALQNATVPTGNVADCLGFDASTITYNGSFPAWQYI